MIGATRRKLAGLCGAGLAATGMLWAQEESDSIDRTTVAPQGEVSGRQEANQPGGGSGRHWLLAGVLQPETGTAAATHDQVLRDFLSGPDPASRETPVGVSPMSAGDRPAGPNLWQAMVKSWTTSALPSRAEAAKSPNPYLPVTPGDRELTTPSPTPASPGTATDVEGNSATAAFAVSNQDEALSPAPRAPFRPSESEADRYFPQLKRF